MHHHIMSLQPIKQYKVQTNVVFVRTHGSPGDSVSRPGQHFQLGHSQRPQGGGPDRGGDLGGVLHHPRVRGPRRVRPHPQDHPGGEETRREGEFHQSPVYFLASWGNSPSTLQYKIPP